MASGMSTNVLACFCALAVFIYVAIRRQCNDKPSLPLPPGPTKWPLIGNLFQLPTSFEWETYAHWGEVYNSDVLHIDAAGTSIVVVNSVKAAMDLFDKRSAIYSSRPQSTMVNDLVQFGWLFGFMPYNEAWKERRRLFQKHFHPLDTMSHQPREIEYTHKMLPRLLEKPELFIDHFRNMIGAITISIAYGIPVQSNDDPYIEIAEEALKGIAAAASPGMFLVESFPFLKHVPSFLPGAGFKRKAKVWRKWTQKMVNTPFVASQRLIAEGKATPSFVSMCLDSLDSSQDKEHQHTVIRDAAANFFVGGADTTVSATVTFVLAMVCYPDVQAKAQEEIDRVVGKGVLPDFTHEQSLPYFAAVIKEVLRWRTITPMAIPHYVTEDDEYKGYLIPKGSIVAGNAWAMLHDKDDYPDPFVFKPERFMKDGKLNHEVRDPLAAFGFGRRVCPGKHIAISTLWITAASILAMFNITKAIDEDGNVIEPSQEYCSSMVMHPVPFNCNIKPRSREAEIVVSNLENAG